MKKKIFGELQHMSKLTELAVEDIRECRERREDLRDYIKENLSNEALAKKYGVHVRTIEKALSYNSWAHVR